MGFLLATTPQESPFFFVIFCIFIVFLFVCSPNYGQKLHARRAAGGRAAVQESLPLKSS